MLCIIYIYISISNGLALFITEPKLKWGGDESPDELWEWKESSLSTEVSNPISFGPVCIPSGSPHQISLLHRFCSHGDFFQQYLLKFSWGGTHGLVCLGLYTRSNFLLGLKASAGGQQGAPGDCTDLQMNTQDGDTKMGNSTWGCSWRCL